MSTAVAPNPDSDVTEDGDLRRLLRDSAAAFARRHGLARARALRETRPGIDRAVWKKMAEQGWLGTVIPENYGGQGLGFAELAVVLEELARTLSPEPMIGCAVL